jgi:seryl-tRNA synthetase
MNKFLSKRKKGVTFYGEEFSELKIPYNTVVVADFADSECEASAKSCYSMRAWSARVL